LIEIQLDNNLDSLLKTSIPYWEKVGKKIANNKIYSNNDILNTAHVTTKFKLEAAHLHLSILNQAYEISPSHATQFLKRAISESILFDLASGLDALAHVINQVYGFSIDFHRVQIDHHRPTQNNEGDCIRCKLDNLNKDNLSKYLNTELPRLPIPQEQEHWYAAFTQYRNQVMHRTLYVINVSAEGLYLPDDPTILNPVVKPYYDVNRNEIVYPNYAKNRELREYFQFCFDKVLSIVEKTHELMVDKI
jgi:hypothetical protein